MPQVFSRAEWSAAGATALLLIFSFPNFEFFPLAWIALVPLLVVIAKHPSPRRAILIGSLTGFVFFYATCYWLTYSMIHYGGIPTVLAYSLLLPGALVIGLFPGLFALFIAIVVKRWGTYALLLAPIFWASCEWFRLGVTGQLWNAIGYSQAQVLMGLMLNPARWGGVYAVGFLIVAVNAAIAVALLKRNVGAFVTLLAIICVSGVLSFVAIDALTDHPVSGAPPVLHVIALQPNVPMTLVKTIEETRELLDRHLSMSKQALDQLPLDNIPRLVVWPESPMNFTYANDQSFQELVAKFTRENHTSLIFNSLEPASDGGAYNSALLINEEGRLIAQYDKIRLLAFGEYVPLPQWLGGSLISGLVGDFTAGTKYTLMPVAGQKAGVFICIESAYPWIAQRLTHEGATFLINISNDGYLGPTAVMRQHLANAIFRAVENQKPLFRVTNTGFSASIRPDGYVQEMTEGYMPEVRRWDLTYSLSGATFYTRHGDIFVELCGALTILTFIAALVNKRRITK